MKHNVIGKMLPIGLLSQKPKQTRKETNTHTHTKKKEQIKQNKKPKILLGMVARVSNPELWMLR